MGERGFANAVVLILLVLGIVVGVFLVQNYTNLFPKAAEIPPELQKKRCFSNEQCGVDEYCQVINACDPKLECAYNPNSAFCRIKQRFCGGGCVAKVVEASMSATPSASMVASPSASMMTASASPSATPVVQNNGACAQVVTKACFPGTNICNNFASPCDVPTGWVVP